MRINGKIIAVVVGTAMLSVAAITATVLGIAGKSMEAESRRSIDLLADRFALRIRLKVELALERAAGLARAFSQAETLRPAERAAYLDEALRAIADSEGVRSAWAAVEAPGYSYAAGFLNGVFDPDPQAPAGADDPRVRRVVEGGMSQVFEPTTVNDADGNPVTLLILAAPVKAGGSISGAVGIELPMSEIASMVAAARSWKDSYGLLVSATGTIVAHPGEVVGKNFYEFSAYSEAERARIEDSIKRRAGAGIVARAAANGILSYQSFMPIPFTGADQVWLFGVSVPIAATQAAAFDFAKATLLIAALVVLGGVVLAFVVGRRISGPIVAVRDAARRMELERDLSFRVSSVTKDETGESIAALEELFAEIRGFIAGTAREAEALTVSGEELAASMEDTRGKAGRIADSAGVARRLAESHGASIQEVATGAVQIAKRAEELSSTAERQAGAAQSSADAIETLRTAAAAVQEGVAALREEFKTLLDEVAVGNAKLEAAAAAAGEVGRWSEDLLSANRTLTQIAGNTNLLAMNAAIEAAHAGDYGAGFAVVASEIRALAETSRARSKDIERTLRSVREGIHGAAGSSLEAREAFTRIQGVVSRVDEIQYGIGSAVSAQADSFETVLAAADEGSESARQVAHAAAEMLSGGRESAREMGSLVEGGLQLLHALDEIDAEARAIAEGAALVAAQGARNRVRIEDLAARAQAFRAGDGLEAGEVAEAETVEEGPGAPGQAPSG